MDAYIDELVLTYDGVSEDSGYLYESLGLDVIYDSHSIRIYSSPMAKIVSINGAIHIHTYIKVNDNKSDMMDSMGNALVVTYLSSQPQVKVAIITSGGDAPGMNSAIRSIVRSTLRGGGKVYGVYRGFDGLIHDYICNLKWDTGTHNSSEGGTVLLSFRSKEFFSREGRKKAVYNLVKRGINSLVVLGGDGSLKGIQILKEEWKTLFNELLTEGKFDFNHGEINCMNCMDDNEGMDGDNEGKDEDNSNTPKEINEDNQSKEMNEDNQSKEINKNESIQYKSKEIDDDDQSKEINDDDKSNIKYYDLVVVGIPASIDNDISLCDYTLGCDTALNRVVESIDHLSSTMKSHQRVFVIEVMGRKCGWLSLMSAYACLADYLLIPESPPLDWKHEIMLHIEYGRKHGKPGIFIIVSEGAQDRDGKLINSTEVVEHIKLYHDVRLLKLGHVQRGGPTSASDRILGTLSGIKAYEELTKLTKIGGSKMIGQVDGEIVSMDLDEVIERNDLIKEYETNLDFKSILNQRGPLFQEAHNLYFYLMENKLTSKAKCIEDLNLRVLVSDKKELRDKYKSVNSSINGSDKIIGIMMVGKRASGMNTALNAVVQYCYSKKIQPMCILNEKIIKPEMYEYGNDFQDGGCKLGGSLDGDLRDLMEKHNMSGLIIIGDPSCLNILKHHNVCRSDDGSVDDGNGGNGGNMNGNDSSATRESEISRIIEDAQTHKNNDNPDLTSSSATSHDRNFKNDKPIILIPASSANNFPCTDFCIGTDTALNTILKVSDCAKLSSMSLSRNVFVLEVAGKHCGYLTCMGAIAAGAFDCFIPERKYLISHLSETAHRLRIKYNQNKQVGTVIFRNETTFCSISTEAFCKVLSTDALNLFDTDYGVLGMLMEGLNPSPIDRVNSSMMAFKAVDYCINKNVGMVGIQGNKITYTEIEKVLEEWDSEKQREKNPKWVKYSNVCKSLE